ncbi:MAG: 3-dehydroquinate synthase [Candidatus Sericytochromatia bacterium]
MNLIKTNEYNIYFITEKTNILHNYISKYSKIFLLTDEIIYENCFDVFLNTFSIDKELLNIIKIKSGEKEKNLETCSFIWNYLTENKADRNSLLINLGGGVVSDMGGFCASIFKRGIDFLNIPTTLLAQVDASVGAKTGIDFNGLKNQIGTFTNPIAIFINPNFLKTLDKRNLLSGYAEMLKHGLLKGTEYFNEIIDLDLFNSNLETLIYKSVEIKKEVVEKDPFEKSIRKTLNLGHTIGHAIESYFLMNKSEKALLHGESVAIGIICELYLSNKIKNFPMKDLEVIKNKITSKFGFNKIEENELQAILSFMKNDKKNTINKINFVLLENIGYPYIDNFIEENEILEAIRYYSN